MKLTFVYNQERDIWCLLTYGKTSMNMQEPTDVYKELIKEHGENPSQEEARGFVENYIETHKIDMNKYRTMYQSDWETIEQEYGRRAEAIFGVTLPYDITAYLTINTRAPYSIQENMFFVVVPWVARKTAMHELWHFYTWEKFGGWEKRIGVNKYNTLKEALTVLLNIECKDLFPEGVSDRGYSQHQELRQNIVAFWEQEKDIEKLWEHFAQQ